MPTLVLPNIPQAMLDDLKRHAGVGSLPDTAVSTIAVGLRSTFANNSAPLPELLDQIEQSAIVDLPFTTKGTLVPSIPGQAPPPEFVDDMGNGA